MAAPHTQPWPCVCSSLKQVVGAWQSGGSQKGSSPQIVSKLRKYDIAAKVERIAWMCDIRSLPQSWSFPRRTREGKRREAKGRETLHAQVPSPAHVSKSQHGGQVPTFEPQETIEMWFTFIEVGS